MTSVHDLDPRTPVLIGVGQAAEQIDSPDYRGLSPVELAAEAARAALADTGVDAVALAARIDTIAGVRQFEISTPVASAPLGRSDNYPRSVADRIGADPARAILEVSGGQSPQHLVNELARDIACGDSNGAVVFGSEAISTARHLVAAEPRPDFSEQRGGDLDDRGYGLSGLSSQYAKRHGLTDAPSQYALLENARRARTGMAMEPYRRAMGELFAPFTRVAAKNPYAAAPVERDAAELSTVTERNRMIADPFPRFMVARDQVNQGAAVVVTSVAVARELGVPEGKWIFLHGHADLREKVLVDRPDLGGAPALVRAAEHALEVAGITVDQLSSIDLYSCFPIAVEVVADGLGLCADDPRGLTLTGGLPFFGGAGNNYSMHAIAETVAHLRATPGGYGFVGANGGTLSKYSTAVYSTIPASWRDDDSAGIQAELDAVPAVEVAVTADGPATVETYTVKYGRSGLTGIVVGRLGDGRRFLATVADGDDELLAALREGDVFGRSIYARSFGRGNRVALDRRRMDALYPRTEPKLRDDYEFAQVSRVGHLLEVTIDRPEARNALTPQANEELDEIFDAFFADSDLWVAILTGAGDASFSAGNDLRYTASGKPSWVPKNGFAGLTGRRDMAKPVIAAVNGFAMGGGCEIALACHLVVADATARFALSEVRVGLVAGAGGLVRLPRVIPQKLATEMILTGKQIDADEAHRLGLVNRVAPAGGALDAARELAAEIIAASPTSVRTSLQIMNATTAVGDVVDATTQRSSALEDLLVSEDMAEGIRAFAEKRAPQWRNR
ncbi:acetyl-CoA acetyltransferase [Gordonia humi]|uniref:Probable enoyl-CoA hydratase EchA17 n=1 Tax=Gordonia humi TaxID=686429 RepID=A0A840EY07_9ACTN|nr:acetyl-CoA acetyltransferase [Gordonia humi]MBB4133839.1 acetyl-CoA C-acetyltransferase [Gordonia humi]